jgi:mRNA interferase RelE/StbE
MWRSFLTWLIDIDEEALKTLSKMDKQVARRIIGFLRTRVAVLEDPRSIGEALKGAKLGAFWKYRVGEHRIICAIEDGEVRILVVRIGHRREIYR